MTMALVAGEREERGGMREGGEKRGRGERVGGGGGGGWEGKGKRREVSHVCTYVCTTCTCVDRGQH